MPDEFEGDLQEAVFWGADLRRATFRDVDLSGVTITHAALVDVTVDALVDRLVINGVDVTEHVNAGDAWFPLRTMLTPAEPADMRATWAALQAEWGTTIDRARALPDAALHESVAGEWSFVETVRHLVFATDKWFGAPVLGAEFDPIGLPNSGSIDFPWPGVDRAAAPTAAEALAVRASRVDQLAEYLESVDETELDRQVDVLENGPHVVRGCIHVVFEEEFWHLRYARRDLATLLPRG